MPRWGRAVTHSRREPRPRGAARPLGRGQDPATSAPDRPSVAGHEVHVPPRRTSAVPRSRLARGAKPDREPTWPQIGPHRPRQGPLVPIEPASSQKPSMTNPRGRSRWSQPAAGRPPGPAETRVGWVSQDRRRVPTSGSPGSDATKVASPTHSLIPSLDQQCPTDIAFHPSETLRFREEERAVVR